jgi:hypothetical protein
VSWWQLDNVLKERAEYAVYYRTRPPVACPNDGQPLVPPPGTAAGAGIELWCPFDGWQYPRDYSADIHSGM